MSEQKDILSLFRALLGAYPTGPKDAETTLKLWQKHLAQYDKDALEYAESEAVRRYKFFPTLSEIVALVDDRPPAPDKKVDQLRAMALDLPDDAVAWRRMAAAFEAVGRSAAAEHAWQKAERLSANAVL